MRPYKPILLVVMLAAVLTGCAARKHIKRGDSYLRTNRPELALRQYEQALRKKPDLSEKEEFVTKLTRARALSAYEQGSRYAKAGDWDQAITAYQTCLKHAPDYASAVTALAGTRRSAAGSLYERAIECADEGKLNGAVELLKRAVELDPENADAREALESVRARKVEGATLSRRRYRDGLAAQRQKRWAQAERAFASAVAADRNDLPSRIERHRSRENLSTARGFFERGKLLLDDKHLDGAVASLQKAVAVWPFYEDANRQLAVAAGRLRDARALCASAETLMQSGRYDQAVDEASAALEMFATYTRAAELLERARTKAAAAHTDAGEALLAKADLPRAEAEFRTALEFVPDYDPARRQLAKLDARIGDDLAKNNLWGHALLRYTEAAELVPIRQYTDRFLEARRQLSRRIAFGVAVDVSDVGGRESDRSAALKASVVPTFLRTAPDFVSLIGNGPAGQARYAVRVTPVRLETCTQLTHTETRTHHYTEYRRVPNPKIADLRGELVRAHRKLARMVRDSHRRCTACRGTGKIRCAKCKGDGRRNDGSRCRHCHGTGRRTCSRCHGTGRDSSVSKSDIRRQSRRVERIAEKLARTPTTVTRAFSGEWPYVVEHFSKTGTCEVSLEVRAADGRLIDAFTVARGAEAGDSTVPQGNPDIGLNGDPLVLPSDEQMRNTLITSTGQATAGRIISAVLEARLDQARSRAQRAQRDGRAEDALEAYADVFMLLDAFRPREAAELFQTLRTGLLPTLL